MSTEHQQYSTENQADLIARYAESHGMSIVKTYADHGRSGLSLAGREGLTQLLRDVEQGLADFTAILVYDVSRWGRFQDADESAYYEYVLKRAGISIHYCAEPFENDGSLPSSLLKTLKRTMAGEYSRELSVKVFAGQCRLIELGFRQGGLAGYGLRRQLVDSAGNPKALLSIGERKSLQTDRVILIPGPEEELKTVRTIYELFIQHLKSEREIASHLNARCILTDLGRSWTRGTVHQILINPKYLGENVYNRRSFKLKRKRMKNPREMWITCRDAFQPVVSQEEFERAQAIIQARHHHWTDDQMLNGLQKLLSSFGRLSGILIDESDELPSSTTYSKRFGSLPRAYKLVGWVPGRDFAYIQINRELRKKHADVTRSIVKQIEEGGAKVSVPDDEGSIDVNGEFTVCIVLARCLSGVKGSSWLVRLQRTTRPTLTIVVRLQPDNENILDYYILPVVEVLEQRLRLAKYNRLALDAYRFDNLKFFISMAKRVRIEDVA